MNWGNKLLVTFLAFGAGIGYLIYRSVNVQYELVEKDYYKSELRYQQVIDAATRGNEYSSFVSVEQTGKGIRLQLPAEMKGKISGGDCWFYCAYDARRDQKFSLHPDAEASQLFPPAMVGPGRYTVKISWISGGKNYYTEKKLTVL